MIHSNQLLSTNEPHLGSNYILDVGDTINLQLTGQKNEETSIIVARDGSISAPYVGSIVVTGLSFDKVYELIRTKYDQSFLGIEAYVTLANLRDKNILIIGAVKFPGTYTLSGGTQLFKLLMLLGVLQVMALLETLKLREIIKLLKILIYTKFF